MSSSIRPTRFVRTRRCRLEPLEDRRLLTAFLVNSLADIVAADGYVTLREALEAANTNAAVFDAPAGSSIDIDRITFAPRLFTDGTNPVPGTITLGGTQLTISESVDIEGPGAELLSIDANHLSRVLYVSAATPSVSGVTITGGAADKGAGIYCSGNLTLASSIVSNNTADTYGGGLCGDNSSGVVTVTNSTVSGNTAGQAGGGLYGRGTLTLIGSTIANNTSTGSVSYGGGICINSSAAILTVANSTISGNSAVTGGGGIVHTLGVLSITNSTITANTTSGQGGGLCFFDPLGITATLHNSVIAGNTSSDNSQVYGAVSSVSSHNLIGLDAGMSGIRDGVNGNQVGVDAPLDPMLGPLADNGGATLTHAPLPGSPLIDSGNDAKAVDPLWLPLVLDQRGFLRRFGTVDIGAVEYQPPGVPIARGDGFVADQGESITLDVLANDFCNDGSPLEARVVEAPSRGALSENPDGTLTYTPEASFWGTDTFSYRAVNGELTSNTVEVVLSVLSPTSIIVTIAGDEDDGDLSPDDISLREAIAMAPPGATIQFSAALMDQVIETRGNSFAPVDVTIIGLGASHLTIRRDVPDRVLYVFEGATSISYLTITGRGVQANSGGSLSLDHVFLTGCTHSWGGAIRTDGGTITVTNSIIAGNLGLHPRWRNLCHGRRHGRGQRLHYLGEHRPLSVRWRNPCSIGYR